MIVTVKTANGSIYELNSESMTWERLVDTERSGQLRSQSGPLSLWPRLTIGRGLTLYGPPLLAHMDGRMIYTSDVVEWWIRPDTGELVNC